jgi:enamine deaminase RidA (YjgF/YER057c/UK114 family)
MWQSGTIKNIVSDKVYLDYVIKHRIFTYDDIYKNTFPSEKAFDELQDTYKEWVKLYKNIKGKSPRVR